MMGLAQLIVTLGGILLIGALARFFFGPKESGRAELRGDVQEVDVTVKGGYSPSVIRVRRGVPLRIAFDRQEGGECTSEVVFSDFRVRRTIPAFARTTVELLPDPIREELDRVRVRLRDEHGARPADRRAGGRKWASGRWRRRAT